MGVQKPELPQHLVSASKLSVFLVVFLSRGITWTVAQSPCEQELCECTNTAGRLTVVCQHRTLTTIPIGVPKNTTALILSNNNIRRITVTDFFELEALETLYLQNNDIDTIEDGAFDNLYLLTTLSLQSNNLQSITGGVFRFLPKLRSIDLSENSIQKIAGDSFLTLPALRTLNLKNNQLHCDCLMKPFKQWLPERSDVTVTQALCRNIRNIELGEVGYIELGENCGVEYDLFSSPQTCYQCENAKHHQYCYNDNAAVTCDAKKVVCYNSIRLKEGRLRIAKGCMNYTSCLREIERNADQCSRTTNDADCNFCCVGELCNGDNIGKRSKAFIFKLTFCLDAVLTPDLQDTSTEQHSVFVDAVKSDIESALENSNGAFVFESPVMRLPRLTVEANLQCTILWRDSKIDTWNSVFNALKMLSTIASYTLKPNTLSLQINDLCSAETTTDYKGTFNWPAALADIRVTVPCPHTNSNEHGSRLCKRSEIGNAVWDVADTSPCLYTSSITRSLVELSRLTLNEQNANSVARQLRNISLNAELYSAYDAELSVDILESLMQMTSSMSTRNTTRTMVDVISNLLNTPQMPLLEAERTSSTASRILNSVEQIAQGVDVQGDEEVQVKSSNIAIIALNVDPRAHSSVTLTVDVQPTEDLTEGQVQLMSGMQHVSDDTTVNSITLPGSLFGELDPEAQSRLTFVVYNDDKLFKVLQNTQSDILTSTVTQSMDTEDKFVNKINSHVIASSVAGVQLNDLEEPVLLTFIHKDRDSYASNPSCVFWEEDDDDGSSWASDGCTLVKSEESYTTCACDHMTNFALLMDVYGTGEYIDEGNRTALSIISYIGCGISLLGLLLTLLTHIVFPKLRKDNPSKILINLCIALAAVNLIFVVGMQEYSLHTVVGCKVVAVLLHYFLLAAMTWMAVEAFYMYLALVRVFNTYYSHFMLKVSLVGWGVPLVIVAITLGIGKTDNYGEQPGKICWLARIPFYASFLAPVCGVLVVNFVAFALVLRQLLGVATKHIDKSHRSSVVSRLRGAIGIIILLGLTWVFAIFAIDNASIVFHYLFAIFNSLQGLFIFVFYCVLKKDARQTWKKQCCASGDDRYSSSGTKNAEQDAINKGYTSSTPEIQKRYKTQATSESQLTETSAYRATDKRSNDTEYDNIQYRNGADSSGSRHNSSSL